MKRIKIIKSIYRRIFGILAVTYLALMIAFSCIFLSQEKKAAGLEFGSFAVQAANRIHKTLNNHIDEDNNITDMSEMKIDLAFEISKYAVGDVEIALFADDYELILSSNDYWSCSYTEHVEGNRQFTTYGLINPKNWFDDDEIGEIEKYIYAYPKAKKVGDLSGYSVRIEGLWTDNEMVIPNRIVITPYYATSFDESGQVKTSSGTNTDEIVYVADYNNTEGLPYYRFGYISPRVHSPGYEGHKYEGRNGLREMVADKVILEETVKNFFSENIVQRTHALTYRYYIPIPFMSEVKIENGERHHSIFWTVIGRDINMFDKLYPTLPFVWLSCLLVFLAAGIIISRQTYKTYMKQEEIERQRKEMTDALAHDLKTPLSIISGYAQNLQENIYTEKREHYANQINANVYRMDQIIGKMLEMSKIESDYFELMLEEVSLQKICTDIINRYKLICHEKFITVSQEGDADISADRSLMERVIDNFFLNAIENTLEGGIIRISISENTFEIYNSGSHIPEDKLDEIWHPYKKGDTQRSNTKGTGLGLSICRTILELHGFLYGARNSEDGVIFWFEY